MLHSVGVVMIVLRLVGVAQCGCGNDSTKIGGCGSDSTKIGGYGCGDDSTKISGCSTVWLWS